MLGDRSPNIPDIVETGDCLPLAKPLPKENQDRSDNLAIRVGVISELTATPRRLPNYLSLFSSLKLAANDNSFIN
jgi:hypothetical protein